MTGMGVWWPGWGLACDERTGRVADGNAEKITRHRARNTVL